jgi:acyl-CoA thioester hydrolase
MNKHFTDAFKVDKTAIDDLNHVNNVIYLDWAQKIAEKHWSQLSNNEINNNYVWVVKRHEIDYYLPVFLNDEIVLNTHIGNSYGVKSERFVNILKEGKLVCSIKTIWILLDKNSMKPVRIPLEILTILDANKID